jgi:hypothetical protein
MRERPYLAKDMCILVVESPIRVESEGDRFRPVSMKWEGVTCESSRKCTKRYEKARTPAQRLLAWSGLRPQERELDPFALKASVERQLRDIFKLRRQLQATRQEAA